MKWRILLADDHQMMRAGLHSLLDGQRDLEVVAEAADGRQAVELAARLSPDLAILDVGMPNLNGIDATRQIRAHNSNVKVIAFSMHLETHHVAQMLAAGASAYVLKDSAFEDLLEAVRSVQEGRIYLSPGITRVVVDDYVRQMIAEQRLCATELTIREREVAQLLAEGRSTKETALLLHVSVKTIESHRHHILEKLNIQSIAELTKYAIREGLTSLAF